MRWLYISRSLIKGRWSEWFHCCLMMIPSRCIKSPFQLRWIYNSGSLERKASSLPFSSFRRLLKTQINLSTNFLWFAFFLLVLNHKDELNCESKAHLKKLLFGWQFFLFYFLNFPHLINDYLFTKISEFSIFALSENKWTEMGLLLFRFADDVLLFDAKVFLFRWKVSFTATGECNTFTRVKRREWWAC